MGISIPNTSIIMTIDYIQDARSFDDVEVMSLQWCTRIPVRLFMNLLTLEFSNF